MLAVLMSIYQKDQLLRVKEALNSVINQTYLFCHIYIQVDGPVNNEIIEFLHSCTNSVFFVCERDKNRGLAVSLNELLNIVLTKEYEYIARMDADDISMPERFAKQIAFMDSHPDIDCLGTWAIEIDNEGKEYFRKKCR